MERGGNRRRISPAWEKINKITIKVEEDCPDWPDRPRQAARLPSL
jgi:hypothetical protein